MRYNNNNNFDLGALLLAGAATYGLYKAGRYIENKYFKGKTEKEINDIINGAFEKINAYAELAKDGGEILRNAVYNLRYGYVNLSADNIDSEAIQKLLSIAQNIETITKDDSRFAEPMEIIDESLTLMLSNTGEKNE